MARIQIAPQGWSAGDGTPLTSTFPALLEIQVYDGATLRKQATVGAEKLVVIRDGEHLEIYVNSKLLYKYVSGDTYGAGTVAASSTEMYYYIVTIYAAEV